MDSAVSILKVNCFAVPIFLSPFPLDCFTPVVGCRASREVGSTLAAALVIGAGGVVALANTLSNHHKGLWTPRHGKYTPSAALQDSTLLPAFTNFLRTRLTGPSKFISCAVHHTLWPWGIISFFLIYVHLLPALSTVSPIVDTFSACFPSFFDTLFQYHLDLLCKQTVTFRKRTCLFLLQNKPNSNTLTMEYSTEDNQNAAPGSVQAAKLNAGRKGPDSQSVTKRYASHYTGWAVTLKHFKLTSGNPTGYKPS